MKPCRLLTSVLVLALVAAIAGCGGSRDAAPTGAPQAAAPGGGTAAGTGRLQLSVRWTQRSRAVPAAAQSVKVDLTDGASFNATRVVDRPAGGSFSTIDFADLPLGELAVTVTAYPQAGAAGTPLAGATLVATVVAGQSPTVSINVESTIDHLVLAEFSPWVQRNGTIQLTATPVDASGAVVPVTPGGIAWISDNPSVATVDAAGLVTGVTAGQVTVKAVERESGKYAIANLTILSDVGGLSLNLVNPTVSVAIAPSEVTLAPGASQQFTATVTGSPNPFVTWSVQEAGGGTITSRGLYTAPLAVGMYHVTATSVADPSKSATATITVGMVGRIVFQSAPPSLPTDLYVINADGTGLYRAEGAASAGIETEPTFSRDGSKIAFAGTTGGYGGWSIFVINADGSGRTRITPLDGVTLGPAWSPDGSRIAYWGGVGADADIFVMNANGSGVTRLSAHTGDDRYPTWSGDGSTIAFESSGDIFTVPVAPGAAVTRITTTGNNERPAWSPDGARIAFSTDRDGGNWEVYAMDPDGTDPTRLTHDTQGYVDTTPAWSPDGQFIAFESNRDGNGEIYAMRPDGSDPVRITNRPESDGWPSWGR